MLAEYWTAPRAESKAGIRVRTRVMEQTEFSDLLDDNEWIFSSTALAPGRLRRVARDGRWRSWFAVTFVDDVPVGLLPMYRSKRPAFVAALYDPARVAPQLFAARRADEYMLVGGSTELVSGFAHRASLDRDQTRDIGTALADAAFEHARARGLTGAALHVRDHEVDAFRGGRSSLVVGQFATLPVPGATPEQYLAMLRRGPRWTVRQEWRALDERGLRGTPVAAADLVEEAVGLVANVKRRHGVPDHPSLIRLRLEDWAAEAFGERIAFTVRENGRLLAVCFACHHGNVLEINEIGLAEDTDTRHLVYVEALVYAPLRYAGQAGCTRIELGLDSSTPKRLRGAVCAPVWAVAGAAEPPPSPRIEHP